MAEYKMKTPLTEKDIEKLRAGDKVLLSGYIYTARDTAHKKLFELASEGKTLPIDIKDQVIYYVGPTPAPPRKVIGSAGPTTSGRMDKYAPLLYSLGLRATIGKGERSKEVREAIKKYKGVYLAAVGGAGALISKFIKSSEPVAYPELGPEAIYRLEVEDFPCIVINDIYGNDLYEIGKEKYQIK
ncbi:MAG: Fe-S-containing hydro-lyase [Candidatus Aminicenantia bacterium]